MRLWDDTKMISLVSKKRNNFHDFVELGVNSIFVVEKDFSVIVDHFNIEWRKCHREWVGSKWKQTTAENFA